MSTLESKAHKPSVRVKKNIEGQSVETGSSVTVVNFTKDPTFPKKYDGTSGTVVGFDKESIIPEATRLVLVVVEFPDEKQLTFWPEELQLNMF